MTSNSTAASIILLVKAYFFFLAAGKTRLYSSELVLEAPSQALYFHDITPPRFLTQLWQVFLLYYRVPHYERFAALQQQVVFHLFNGLGGMVDQIAGRGDIILSYGFPASLEEKGRILQMEKHIYPFLGLYHPTRDFLSPQLIHQRSRSEFIPQHYRIQYEP